jgi:hypothetical protein
MTENRSLDVQEAVLQVSQSLVLYIRARSVGNVCGIYLIISFFLCYKLEQLEIIAIIPTYLDLQRFKKRRKPRRAEMTQKRNWRNKRQGLLATATVLEAGATPHENMTAVIERVEGTDAKTTVSVGNFVDQGLNII